MRTLIEIARVRMGGRTYAASDIFAAHVRMERTIRERAIEIPGMAAAEEEIERLGLAPLDRLMRQVPHPR